MNRYLTRVQRLEQHDRKAGVVIVLAEPGQTEADALAEAMAKRPDLARRMFVVLTEDDQGF